MDKFISLDEYTMELVTDMGATSCHVKNSLGTTVEILSQSDFDQRYQKKTPTLEGVIDFPEAPR